MKKGPNSFNIASTCYKENDYDKTKEKSNNENIVSMRESDRERYSDIDFKIHNDDDSEIQK